MDIRGLGEGIQVFGRKKGWVKRETIRDHMPAGFQGLFLNTRRKKFQDIRVRKALTYAFDFERLNKTALYGLYKRCLSIFANQPLAARGKPSRPSARSWSRSAIQLPPEVFGHAFTAPRTDGSRGNRDNLDEAAALLYDAGYSLEDGKLTGPDGALRDHVPDRRSPDVPILGPITGAEEPRHHRLYRSRCTLNDYDNRVRSYDYDVISARP